MRAAVFNAPGDITVEDVPDASVDAATDAVVRITHACICGSDLWSYRDIRAKGAGGRCGHELIGIVEAVGAEVTSVRPGDRVVSPFVWSCGSCGPCLRGLTTSCVRGGIIGGPGADGGQAEAARIPWADGTLVKAGPDLEGDDAALVRLAALTDVLPTGHHAALSAGVTAGSVVAVVGDGAVGLCGVLAAARLGAARIIALGHHPARLELARRFGATDVVTLRGPEAVEAVRELTGGEGAHAVLECVGTQEAMVTAFGAARAGGGVGFVGVPAQVEALPVADMFSRNVSLRGGIAPVRAYFDELLPEVVSGALDASAVFDLEVPLAEVAAGYTAMDQRTATKVLVRV